MGEWHKNAIRYRKHFLFPVNGMKAFDQMWVILCVRSERERPDEEEKKWTGEETARKSVWKCWKTGAIALHLSWILSKHGPHWPGSPTQIIHESMTPTKHTHTQTHTFSVVHLSHTWVRHMDTSAEPSRSNNTHTSAVTAARRGTTGGIYLEHIRDSLKRHKARQNHMNILLMSFSCDQRRLQPSLKYSTLHSLSSASHCGGGNIYLKKTPWKWIPNVTRKDEERVFVPG